MNRVMRVIVILGVVVILVLFAILYLGSNKVLREVEKSINNMLEHAKLQIEDPQQDMYGIKKLDYKPFRCSGLLSYKCKSDSISIYMGNPTLENTQANEIIRFVNFTISGDDIKSNDHLSFNIQTDIEYPLVNILDNSKKDAQIALIKAFNAVLPKKLLCYQDYSHKNNNETLDSILQNTRCDIESEILSTNVEVQNVFSMETDKPHIFAILRDIAMNINSNNDSRNDILYEFNFAKLSLKNKETFDEFLSAQSDITEQQGLSLKTILNVSLDTAPLLINAFVTPYLRQNATKVTSAIASLVRNDSKQLDIEINSNDGYSPTSLKTIMNMDISELIDYINENCNFKIMLDGKEHV